MQCINCKAMIPDSGPTMCETCVRNEQLREQGFEWIGGDCWWKAPEDDGKGELITVCEDGQTSRKLGQAIFWDYDDLQFSEGQDNDEDLTGEAEVWHLIKLWPGEKFAASKGEATEEGYSASSKFFHHQGDRIVCEMTTDGRDCDGRHEWRADYFIEIHDLPDPADAQQPEWVQESSSQRDHTAESMGY